MKKLLVVILVMAALWAGYWFVGSTSAKRGFESWFEARRAAGWQADYADITMRGFPNRFDTTFTNPALADPGSGLAWQAPFLQIFTLSYKPNHIIVAFPEQQTISTPQQRYRLESTNMRASMVMQPDTSLAFERANLVSDALSFGPQGRDHSRISSLQAALRRVDGTQYRLAVNAEGLTPALAKAVSSDLPESLSAFRADATVAFSKAWDISALESARPQPTEITLHLAEAKWGKLELAIAGALTVTGSGTPEGTLTVKARNWREIIALARVNNAAPALLIDQVEQALALLSRLNGNPDTLDVPLGFSGGYVKLGPVPVAPAPRLVIK